MKVQKGVALGLSDLAFTVRSQLQHVRQQFLFILRMVRIIAKKVSRQVQLFLILDLSIAVIVRIQKQPRFHTQPIIQGMQCHVRIDQEGLPIVQDLHGVINGGREPNLVMCIRMVLGRMGGFVRGQMVHFDGRNDTGKMLHAGSSTPGHPQVIGIFVIGRGGNDLALVRNNFQGRDKIGRQTKRPCQHTVSTHQQEARQAHGRSTAHGQHQSELVQFHGDPSDRQTGAQSNGIGSQSLDGLELRHIHDDTGRTRITFVRGLSVASTDAVTRLEGTLDHGRRVGCRDGQGHDVRVLPGGIALIPRGA
mmetsp:Transcript_17902/g.34062  ORF Transcript_17902/g.34062 Transcript_17902/m.34062 type:complete len:306 (+) Transcript_17902:658-1575(+)|eukprot:scaffold134_cov94-Amphora_coffeaeformis.AAC.13